MIATLLHNVECVDAIIDCQFLLENVFSDKL